MDGPQPDIPGARTDRPRHVEAIAAGLTLLAGLGILAGAMAWRHRSAEAALMGGLGRSLVPDAMSKTLGDVAPDGSATVAFTLRNSTSHPIRIQGAQTSCSCTIVEGIPCMIEPGGSRDISGVVHAADTPGRFDGSFVLYTDDDRMPELRLGYSGRVVAAPRRMPDGGP